jgi:CRISPR-associated protein Csb1
MEQALQDALDAGEIRLPIITVDFSEYGPTGDQKKDENEGRLLDAIGKLTSLQVPHRLADAILRDSEHNGEPFRKSAAARSLNQAGPLNATPLFELCPTALVFGMWDSTGPKGGLGMKFERAIVSEVVGIGAEFGLKTASRIDPLITATSGIVLYRGPDGGWTLDISKAVNDKSGKPIKLGRKGDGKVSEANLGNVTPSFAKYIKGAEGSDPMNPGIQAKEGGIAPGGVTIQYAEQSTTLSLIALRRLRFPVGQPNSDENAASVAARAVLAALGLCAATLAFEPGMGLRSRCLLWPDGPMRWELLAKAGEPPHVFTLDAAAAKRLLADSVHAAEETGLRWQTTPLTLKPSKKLLELVRLSQQQSVKEGTAEEA